MNMNTLANERPILKYRYEQNPSPDSDSKINPNMIVAPSKVVYGIKDKLTNKEILCLVSTLFEEGLDLVSLDYTINLVGGLDNIGVFQKMRSITAHKDKTKVGIIDFIHQCKYLKRHSKRRLDLYKSEPEFSVEIRDVSKKSIDEIFV